MRGSVSVVGVLVLLFVSNVFCQLASTNLSAITVQGIDMIMVDAPGWITHIQRSWVDREVFIFGQSTMRPVAMGDALGGFQVMPASSSYDITLQDLCTVYINGTDQYSFGLANYDVDHDGFYSQTGGPYVPLVLLGGGQFQWSQKINDPLGNNWGGIMMAAIRTDPFNLTDVQSYVAGWIVSNNATVQFAIIRTHFDASALYRGLSQKYFVFDPILDVGILYPNKFSTFSPDNKPWVHFSPGYGTQNQTLVIIADPNTRTVYSGFFTATGWTLTNTQYINMPNYQMVSTTYSYFTQQLYVGMAQSGFNVSGAILRFDYTSVSPAPIVYTLPPNTNNPKALALDDFNNTLYIGLNGGSKVLRFDLSLYAVTGYQSLPEWLHRTWAGVDMHHHVYFVTYEEHAKIYRVSKNDFCLSECPYMGYCASGACTCSSGYSMSNGACVITTTLQFNTETKLFNVAHGGEIALGVFFALAVVAAAAGWFMWWRGRRGSYQSV